MIPISMSESENHVIMPPSLHGTLIQFPPCPTHTLECALQSDVRGAPELWPRWTTTIPPPPHHAEGKLPLSRFSALADALDDNLATQRLQTVKQSTSIYVSMLQHALTPGANIIDYWPIPNIISNSTVGTYNNNSPDFVWHPTCIPLSRYSTLAGALDDGPLSSEGAKEEGCRTKAK